MEYVAINIEDMREAFSKRTAAGGWDEKVNGYEICFEWEFQPKVTIIVYSSFRIDAALARAKGLDAIRVVAVDFRKGTGNKARGLVSSVRVLRVKGWKENLKKAITNVYHLAKKRVDMPQRPFVTPLSGDATFDAIPDGFAHRN